MSEQLQSPYRTPDGAPWTRMSWVVFLDVLGFSSRVLKAATEGKEEELLGQLLAAMAEAKQDLIQDVDAHLKYGLKVAPYAVKFFTDNLVLGFPIIDDGEAEFGRMINVVGRWQYTLVKHGFFVRGGITAGPIYMDDDMAFGKGLLDAYAAESKLARDPRVVLAPEAMNLVHHHLAYYHKVVTSPHNVTLLLDADSQMFLNYLYQPIDDNEEVTDEFLEELKCHGEIIRTRLEEFASDPSIWSKYAWAGAYHNHFCSHLPAAKHLQLDSKLFSQPPRFLSEVYKRKGAKIFRGDEDVATIKYSGQWKIETKLTPPCGIDQHGLGPL